MDVESIGTQTDKSQFKKKPKGKKVLELTVSSHARRDINKEESGIIHSCEYEIFGIVQDVSFRHYTLRRAQKLGVRGWCMNTSSGTVKGVIQGTPISFEAMRIWLRYTGSPTSRIDKCVFGPVDELEDYTYPDFSILKEIPA